MSVVQDWSRKKWLQEVQNWRSSKLVGFFAVLCVIVVFVSWYFDTQEQSMIVEATAYNSLISQTDQNPTEAAWGDILSPGVRAIAISPDLEELGMTRGTEVSIEGLPGRYVVLDKTASRWKRRIDIYMGEDLRKAIDWGRKKVEIRWKE